jgi:radical SAM superfamily enzyme YgiQ (UPF0313 family)
LSGRLLQGFPEVIKIVLAGINSRYNHINLAIRSIESYVQHCTRATDAAFPGTFELVPRTFTITEPLLSVLRGIALEKPAAVLFSVYIWNSSIVSAVIPELRKILPDVLIGAGGPEVSFHPDIVFSRLPALDFIMAGEGEQTVSDICSRIGSSDGHKDSVLPSVSRVPGVWTRSAAGAVAAGGPRPLFKTLDTLPFPYENSDGSLVDWVDPENSIAYYESSRGCPFSCSYCLSSLDKSVRFRSLNLVFHDLQFFLDHNFSLVKFVDRTFNINEARYVAIWQYIAAHWNSKTTFHFEIAAEQLTAPALAILRTVPYGMMQFEIGIQSTNPPTLEQVGRSADLNHISSVLAAIPRSIHVHLDLIAGLPYESPAEFRQSFNYTIARMPEMLQFGFLKILPGTKMESYAQATPGYTWLSVPPYEVLSSPWVDYLHMQEYKDIEELVDIYYNGQNFVSCMRFLISCAAAGKISLYDFFSDLAHEYARQGLAGLPHKTADHFLFLYHYFETGFAESGLSGQDQCILGELLRFDFIRREKPGAYPDWYEQRYDKTAHRNALEKYGCVNSVRMAFATSSYEQFLINPLEEHPVADGNLHGVLLLYAGHKTGAAAKTGQRYFDTTCVELP